jgi:TetR/AcrR family transcriptional repressor of nem operon
MARTKSFDVEDAVDRALGVFWEKGYAATSAQDLVDALGINRSSLYGTFGSKDELYQRALARYVELSGLAGLRGEGPLRPRLRRALWAAAEPDLEPRSARGCFACNAALERGAHDGAVRAQVRASFQATRDILLDELVAARDRGELPAEADLTRLADGLVVMVEGLHVVALGTRDRALVAHAIDAAVDAL